MRSRSSLPQLIGGLVITLAFGLTLSWLGIRRIQDYLTERQLQQEGQDALGTLLHTEGINHQTVVYEFAIPTQDGTYQLIQAREDVSRARVAALRRTSSVTIRYLPSDPRVSRIATGAPHAPLAGVLWTTGGLLLFGVMGLAAAGVSAWELVRRRRNRGNGSWRRRHRR